MSIQIHPSVCQSVHLDQSICLSIFLLVCSFIRTTTYKSVNTFICSPASLSINATIQPHVCLSVCFSVCLSVSQWVSQSVNQLVSQSLCLFLICRSVCLSVGLSIRPSFHPSVCPSVRPFILSWKGIKIPVECGKSFSWTCLCTQSSLWCPV